MWGAWNQTDPRCYRSSSPLKHSQKNLLWSSSLSHGLSVCMSPQINRVITERLICDVCVFVCCLLSHSLNSGTLVWKLKKNSNNTVDNYLLIHCSNLKSPVFVPIFFPVPFAFVAFIHPDHVCPPSLPSRFFCQMVFPGFQLGHSVPVNTNSRSTCGDVASKCSLTCFVHDLTQHSNSNTLRLDSHFICYITHSF